MGTATTTSSTKRNIAAATNAINIPPTDRIDMKTTTSDLASKTTRPHGGLTAHMYVPMCVGPHRWWGPTRSLDGVSYSMPQMAASVTRLLRSLLTEPPSWRSMANRPSSFISSAKVPPSLIADENRSMAP